MSAHYRYASAECQWRRVSSVYPAEESIAIGDPGKVQARLVNESRGKEGGRITFAAFRNCPNAS